MITKAKVIRDINHVRTETPVKFKNFGGFFLRLMMLSVEDQEFLVAGLKNAADRAKETDMINIITFSRPAIKLKESEQHFRFLIEHEFRCSLCSQISSREVNMCKGHFAEICEVCYDKAEDYRMDAANEAKYD